MRNIRVVVLTQINLIEMTEIWNRCWRGYYYDMWFTPDQMRAWLDLTQVSPQHSMAIFVDDQIAGFALLSLEGVDGWIAGTCIDPNYRRKGLFTALMRLELDLARRLGLKRVYLEVLEQNPALKIYQSLGFTQIRQLNIYRVHTNNENSKRTMDTCPLDLIPLETYFYNRRSLFKPAWQRREGYLKRHVNTFALINSNGSAGVLFGGDKIPLVLDAWSTTVVGATDVIAAITKRSKTSWSLTNQPDDEITRLCNSRGVYPSAKQYEMCVELT
ncbi:GNAT family N-acetyltransferase [Desulfosporosinus fructosivorans]